MNKTASILTAATAGLGLAVASTSAKAFVPRVLGAIIGGAALGGVVLGNAATNSYYAPTAPVVEPGVTVGSTSCHFAHRWVDGVRERVRVCHTVAP
jgi:hypothetical protein